MLDYPDFDIQREYITLVLNIRNTHSFNETILSGLCICLCEYAYVWYIYL